MMLKTLEKSGKTEEAAIAAALEELGLDRGTSRRAMRASARSSAACLSIWAFRRRLTSPLVTTAV